MKKDISLSESHKHHGYWGVIVILGYESMSGRFASHSCKLAFNLIKEY